MVAALLVALLLPLAFDISFHWTQVAAIGTIFWILRMFMEFRIDLKVK